MSEPTADNKGCCADLKARLLAWLAVGFRPVPVGRVEWFIMRLAFAVVVFFAVWDKTQYAYDTQTHPNGIALLINLTWISQEWVRPTFITLCGIAGLLYVAGRAMPIALGILSLVNILPRTLVNSNGHIGHSHQIISIVILAQFGVALWWHFRERHRTDGFIERWGENITPASFYLYYTQGILAGAYVVAGLSKLLNSKGMWVWNAPYISFDLVKSQRQSYYKLMEDETLLTTARAAEWVLEHPMLARLGFAGGFFLELLALIALKNRAWAFWMGLGLIALHRSIHLIMNLNFWRNDVMLLIFFVNLPFWFWWAGKKLRGSNHQPLVAEAGN